METQTNLPPEMQSVLDAMSADTSEVRSMFRYALVLMMIDDEKARVTGKRVENGREMIAVRTIGGDAFEIERPEMSEELERMLLEQVRAIMEEENDG